MKITSMTTYAVPPRWLFLKIETDSGIVGWGEPVLEGRAATVAAAVDELSDYLIGQDPGQIEDLWNVMYRAGFYRGGGIHMSALAGIDQALWDIKGKAFGVPAYELLGGKVRDRIKVYSWVGGDRPADTADAARDVVERGFSAVKLLGTEELQYIDGWDKVERCTSNIGAVRDAVGPDVGIGVDFHGRVHKPMAKVLLRELEPFHLMFVEEPVLSEHLDGCLDVLRNSPIPIALGERLYSRWDFKSVIASGAVDIIQPDPSHCGGITEARKIAPPRRGIRRGTGAALPAGPHRTGRLPADRCQLLQRRHPGAEPRHPLQHHQRTLGLPGGPVGLRLPRRLRVHPVGPRPRHRDQ